MMARIVKHTKRPHDCRAELGREIIEEIYFGTVVECSCGNQFMWVEHQIDGPYWVDHKPTKEDQAVGYIVAKILEAIRKPHANTVTLEIAEARPSVAAQGRTSGGSDEPNQ